MNMLLTTTFTMSVFFILLFPQILASNNGISNLLGFYMSFRKLCLCRCGISQNRINGLRQTQALEGDLTSPYEMPWLATINTKNTTFRGALISDRHVITAATPVYGLPASDVKVTLGVHDQCKEGQALNISVESISIHPGYSHIVRNNDMALLKLRHTVQFSQFIVPICMPVYEIGDTEHLAWTPTKFHNCLVRIVSLPILSSQSCLRIATASNDSQITPDKGCIGPLGSKSVVCQDDIGGPVMTRWYPGLPFRLAGVIASASCEDNTTTLFTKTVDNLLWIHENIRNDCQCF